MCWARLPDIYWQSGILPETGRVAFSSSRATFFDLKAEADLHFAEAV